MSKLKKKKLIVVCLTLIIAAIIVCVIVMSQNRNENDGYNIAAEALDIEFNADIMVYGENPEFRDTVKYRTIDKITEEALNYEEEHGYRAIILFDHKGTMSISDNELLLIKKFVEEKGYDMIYVGKNYLDDFKRLGFTVGCAEDAYSLEYVGSIHIGENVQQNETGNLYAIHGLWCDADEETLEKGDEEIQSRIVMIMYDYAREAAGIEF